MHWIAHALLSARYRWLAATLLVLLAQPLWAATPIPSAPSISAKAYILQDYDSGRVIADSSADERVEPASLTKMMTAYVVSNELRNSHLKLTDMVRISEKAWRAEGSRMFVEVNTSVSVEDLLRGVIIQSGNDACIALAEHIAGSEEAFAEMMNDQARRLGMSHTHFVNSTGLPDPEHYTTARDLATLSIALIRDFPDHYNWYSERDFTYNDITQHNRNTLLWWDKTVDGIKTGHTSSAGYCLAASALKEGMRLVSVVLGTDSEKARARESQSLLTYGFRFFETHRLYQAGQSLADHRLWMGAQDTLPVGLERDLFVTIPRGQYDSLQASLTIDNHVEAPVTRGTRYGTVNVSLNGQPVAEAPLVALADVEEGGIWRRFVDWVTLLFYRLWS
jgi:D-alanyl-D-alanine carboxypeptidase (penicillin-binding protein 5/6)